MATPRLRPAPSTPLAHTQLQVTVTDLVAEYVLRHHFQNTGSQPIEAVFSFPVPLDAAFLGMQATLAGETVMAQIQPQRQASRTYDDAMAQGHSAVLLRNPEPGVLCTSLGNLLPGEEGVVELRFATALGVADRTARFTLPLVHRPRYGTWRLEQLEQPTHDFAVVHPLTASIRVQGLLATAPVSCLTHAVRFARAGDAVELSLPQAQLDRDLVLTFELPADLPPRARLLHDGEGALGLLSFVLPPAPEAALPMDLCLVLDGSGSMQGDAIEQSRAATLAVVAALRSDDRVQVLRFGNETLAFFRRPLLATARVCQALCELVTTIDANLGGTNMDDALERALRQLGPAEAGRARAIILVTDGAVQPHDVRNAQAAATKAGVRLFVVAVGSTAGTEVLGPLAQATGATLERAVPGEPIDAGVMRQFRRARQAGPVRLRVRWPQAGAVALPVGNAYAGDAVQVAAVLPGVAAGSVTVSAGEFLLALPLGEPEHQPAMRALCGMARYRAAARGAREALAMAYGLLTPETSAVLVKLRADGEVGDALPEIVRVPQMVSKGTVGRTRSMVETCQDAAVFYKGSNADDYSEMMPLCLLRAAAELENVDLDADQNPELYKKEEAPALDHEAIRRALSLLYRILQSKALDASGHPMPLGKLVYELPAHLQPFATEAIAEVGLSLNHPVHSLYLLVMLNRVLALDELDEPLELAISRLVDVEDVDLWLLKWTTTLHRLLGE